MFLVLYGTGFRGLRHRELSFFFRDNSRELKEKILQVRENNFLGFLDRKNGTGMVPQSAAG